MAKEYANIRIEDLDLHDRAKIRAIKESTSLMDITQRALKEYLKKPMEK